jgi:ribonuclease P protein component
MWISQENENGKRSKSDQQTPQSRTQKALRLNSRFSFPKSARLLSRNQFRHVLNNRKKVVGHLITMDYRKGRSPCPKLGITVSRRFGKAVLRNRFKRLLREAFRHVYGKLPKDIEINAIPRARPDQMNKAALEADLTKLAQ